MTGYDYRLNRKLDCILHNQRTLAAMIKLVAVNGTLVRSDDMDLNALLQRIDDRVADAQTPPPNTGVR